MFALLAALAYYVIVEHGAHLFAALPLLFLLACPLMHLFHGGHGGHGGRGGDAGRRPADNTPTNNTGAPNA